MEKALAKQLDRIRKAADKGGFDKALSLADEVMSQYPGSKELISERLRALMHCRPWSDVLQQLKQAAARFELVDLLLADSRDMLRHLFVDNAPFRGALLDYLMNIQAFDQITYLIRDLEEAERIRMVESWSALADEIQDEAVATSWRVAAGLGWMVTGHHDRAWEMWQGALRRDPRFLKKIMALCNRLPDFDLSSLHNRLRIIRLIVAAGKRDESLSLLQALGAEKPENALQILIEIPEIMGEDVVERDVCQLRFNLACQLADRELMGNVIADMLQLDEADLFAFQKQALVNLEDRQFKRYVLLQIGELYIRKGLWEPAALLLESLHQEDEHPEVVALMEHVLDNYPILPHLHLTVAQFQVRNNYKENALRHLTLIKEVGEFTNQIRELLEPSLAESFDSDYADFLFDILPQDSSLAALLALRMTADADSVEESFYERVLIKAPQLDRPPFWLMALAEVCRLSGKRDESVAHVAELLQRFPELSPEALRIAEYLTEIPGHFQPLAKAIAENLDQMEPRDLWLIVKRQCEKAFPAIATQPVVKSEDRDTTITDQGQKDDKSPFSKGLNEITSFVSEGEMQAAAQMAERLAERYPDRFRIVLSCLERFREDDSNRILWDKCRLNILIRAEAYDEAAQAGQEILMGPVPQDQLASIQQLVAFAHEGRGQHGEALKFFCLSSKNPRFYSANKTHLIRLLFPHHKEMVNEVLQVIMLHKDTASWQRVLSSWERNEPKDKEERRRWQMRFAQHARDPEALIEVAKWALAEGRVKDGSTALSQLNLKTNGLESALQDLVNSVKSKNPQDIQAGFVLGRYFLVHEEIPKSVTAFRELVSRAPEAAPRLFEYLKKFLDVHREHQGNVRLFGLLIRVGLDLNYMDECVAALNALGSEDRLGALTLADGITRVMLKPGSSPAALVALMELFSNWGAHDRVVDLAMNGQFGRTDVERRVAILEKALDDSHHGERAQLALATLHFSIQQFDACRSALSLIQDDDVRSQALELYNKLVERFPKDASLVREAAWASWLNGRYDEAVRHFTLLFDLGDPIAAVEAYAALAEREVPVSFSDLLERTGIHHIEALRQLRVVYGRIREMDLLRWERQGGPIPAESLEWLLSVGQLKRFHQLFEKMRSFVDRHLGERLQALYLAAQGKPYFGAMRLAQGAHDVVLKRSLLASCGMHEAALLIRDDNHITPLWLKREFLNNYGQPKWINMQVTHAQSARTEYSERSQMRGQESAS